MAGFRESCPSWEEIAGKPNSGVKKVHHKLHLSFPPYYLADLKKSVASVLDSRLNNYEEKYSTHMQCDEHVFPMCIPVINQFSLCSLGGLLAGYGKISILKSVGETLYNNCEIHIDVVGDFYVFSPEVGIELIGKYFKNSTHRLTLYNSKLSHFSRNCK